MKIAWIKSMTWSIHLVYKVPKNRILQKMNQHLPKSWMWLAKPKSHTFKTQINSFRFLTVLKHTIKTIYQNCISYDILTREDSESVSMSPSSTFSCKKLSAPTSSSSLSAPVFLPQQQKEDFFLDLPSEKTMNNSYHFQRNFNQFSYLWMNSMNLHQMTF